MLSFSRTRYLVPLFNFEEQTPLGSRAEEKTWTWQLFHHTALATCCDGIGWRLV
jgi:hypothetical protein